MTAVPMAEQLTAQAEDYLRAIYEVEQTGSVATTNDIAQRLEVAAPSATAMFRRLAEHGWVEHEKYRGVALTDSGRRAALRTLRRHRVVESYLVRALGYPWDEVHDEADRLEHTASDVLIDRMAAAIGWPTVDPHGEPIPTRDGAVDETRYRALSTLRVGECARVVRVSDEDPALLRYLAELGLVPGHEVRVTARAPFDGPISLDVGDSGTQVVGPSVASNVLIEPAEQPAERPGK